MDSTSRRTDNPGPSRPWISRPTISISVGSPCAVVELVGPLAPHAAGLARAAMQEALARRPAAVIVDLSQAQVEDAGGVVAMLVLMKRHARRLGAAFIVAAPPWLNDRIGVNAILTVTPTLGRALEVASRTAGCPEPDGHRTAARRRARHVASD